MNRHILRLAILTCGTVAAVGMPSAQTLPLVAIGNLTQSRAGSYTDLSGLTYTLENGVPANLLGGLGSGITYARGNTFLALPDRGPNAVSYNSAVDDTVSYVNRFHTVRMRIEPNTSGTGLPLAITPVLQATTLLWDESRLVYGSGATVGLGSGAPVINTHKRNYFTGRSDNFDPDRNSGNSRDARFDTEGIRMSNDGKRVYISDEYGPYIYEFERESGQRIRSFRLPDSFFVTNLSPVGATEISGNTAGRTANKGMEGLAITPDGRTLVGMVQAALIQDANLGGAAATLLRIVTIDLPSGRVTHQYGYELSTGSGVSEVIALNNQEFLVDERDGKGRGDGSNAKNKQLYKINLEGATDISDMDGATAALHAVPKTLFVDLAKSLTNAGYTGAQVPAKIEGLAFGPDVQVNGSKVHTLWVANDNDFLSTVADPTGTTIDNPNQFFVFSFTDADLGGSPYTPQPINVSKED
jgi:Esterase-like activity of phytase